MKKKTFKTTLNLKKITISNLNEIRGNGGWTEYTFLCTFTKSMGGEDTCVTRIE